MSIADKVKSAIPTEARSRLSAIRLALRQSTAAWRALPDFIIIGAQKSGTGSLFRYLDQHPDVAPALRKEVHFFDRNYERGTNWYRAHFPLRGRGVTGEGSPSYLVHHAAAERAAHLVGSARLIALLRNPVDRAYSSYHHVVRHGDEDRPFNEAVEEEIRTIPPNFLATASTDLTRAYVLRGCYASQLLMWFDHFPREQILVLCSERLFRETRDVFESVLQFLGLRSWEPSAGYRNYSAASYPELEVGTREVLAEFYKPHNERLYELIGEDLGWG